MKILKYSLLLIVAIVLLCCEEKENFQFCDAIQKAYQARCTRSMRGINTDSLAIINAVCIEKEDMSSSCICEAIIGYDKFFKRDYLNALIMMKNAESKLQYCDSMSAFVYHYLSEILAAFGPA